MKVDTPRWGSLEISPEDVIHFETGLAGFPECSEFIVMDHDRSTPIKWLQCIDVPDLSFVIIEPEQIVSSYTVDVPEPVMRKLGWTPDVKPSPADVAVFVILNCDSEELTANLRAPVVVNVANRRAIQLILDDPSVSVRYPVVPLAPR